MMEESRQMERIVAKERCEEWERGEREEGERGRGKNGKEREATKEILFHPLARKREREWEEESEVDSLSSFDYCDCATWHDHINIPLNQ